MLVLTRKPGEKIMLGDDIVITFLENRGGEGIRIGIDAPRHVRIKRHEIFAAVADANRQAASDGAADASAEERLLGLLGGVDGGVDGGVNGGAAGQNAGGADGRDAGGAAGMDAGPDAGADPSRIEPDTD